MNINADQLNPLISASFDPNKNQFTLNCDTQISIQENWISTNNTNSSITTIQVNEYSSDYNEMDMYQNLNGKRINKLLRDKFKL